MEKIYQELKEVLVYNIRHSIQELSSFKNLENDKLFNVLYNAYNRFREEEYDGVEYIFDLLNPEDLKICVEYGMGAYTIAEVINSDLREESSKAFVLFDSNPPKAELLNGCKDVLKYIDNYLEEIVPCILKYPYVSEYSKVYEMYVTEVLMDAEERY